MTYNLEYALAQQEKGRSITITSERPIICTLHDRVDEAQGYEVEAIERVIGALNEATHDELITFPLNEVQSGVVMAIDLDAVARTAEYDEYLYWENLITLNTVIGGIARYVGKQQVDASHPITIRLSSTNGGDIAMIADVKMRRQATIALQYSAVNSMVEVAKQLASFGGSGFENKPGCLVGDDKRTADMSIGTHTRLSVDRGADDEGMPSRHREGVMRLVGNNITHPAHPIIFLAGLVALTHS